MLTTRNHTPAGARGSFRRGLAWLALVGLLLAACSAGTPPSTPTGSIPPTGRTRTAQAAPHVTPTRTSPPSAPAPPPTPTPPAPARTATQTPTEPPASNGAIAASAAAAASAASAATAAPSLTPAGPLAAGGPWLLLEQSLADPNQPGRLPDIPRYLAANADGSGLQQMRLPDPGEARAWLALPNERGTAQAFFQVLREGFSFNYFTDRERYEPYLWIARLPENQVARQIPLLGPLGWEQVARERARIANRVEIPLTLGLVTDPRSAIWSPDGSRLAFSSGARGAAADIFLYSPADDAVAGVTFFNTVGAQPWFWSADGGWLIFRTGRRYTAQGMSRLSNAYALSMEPGSRPKKLYSPRTAEEVLGVTVVNFLVYERAPESQPCRLRRVEYTSGKVEMLYPGCFAQAAAEPGGPILLNFTGSPSDPADDGRPPAGIYRLDPRTRETTLLLAGNYHLEPWDPQRRAFAAVPSGEVQPRFFRVGPDGAPVDVDPRQITFPSPDARRRVRYTLPGDGDPGGLALLAGEGEEEQVVADLDPGPWGKVRWRADSGGFYALRCAEDDRCALGLFESAAGWQPEWVVEAPGLRSFWLINP